MYLLLTIFMLYLRPCERRHSAIQPGWDTVHLPEWHGRLPAHRLLASPCSATGSTTSLPPLLT